ncbi:McrB family protein [Sporosarcina sp. FSL K6-5500]|uniref:McrB family protein n=1 Tax=Sporosarcina sp. FSL K6-5500 TaxID=2921558 RepID=UPI0030F5FEC9
MNLTVNQAVWLAAAMMTYERFNKNQVKSMADIALVQTDIKNRAQSLTDSNVENARISQHFNGDHVNKTNNFFRQINEKNRRLCYPGEFNGEKERPDLNVQDSLTLSSGEQITVDQLVDFVETDYRAFFDNKESDTFVPEIDFKKIITHLYTYANHAYKGPHQLEEKEKQKYLAIRESGSAAVNELNKLADSFAAKYGVKNKNKSKWLTGGNDVVRRYLWNQLKYEEYKDVLTSISIFVEKNDEDVQFRISIELDEKRAEQSDFDRHHKMLNKPLIQDEQYCYYIKANRGWNSEVSYEPAPEIQKKIQDGEYKKVQIVYHLTDEQIQSQSLTNEMIYQKLDGAFGNLIAYYNLVIGKVESNLPDKEEFTMFDKNMILYGPPGTGKTYKTVIYAVAIIENSSIESLLKEDYQAILKRYNDYKKSGQINFTTFHQSFGYEEFIEGIKPALDEDQDEQLQYKIEPGIFKDFCENAQQLKVTNGNEALGIDARVWKVSLGGSGMNDVKEDCFENNRIRIGWDEFGEDLTQGEEYPAGTVEDILYSFYDDMSIGDVVFSLGDQKHVDAIGIITGEPEWLGDEERYKRSRSVKWIAKNIQVDVYDLNGKKNLTQRTVYELKRMSIDSVNQLILKHSQDEQITVEENHKNYVFIIDEINRGNISKILGELITLIEPTKRLGAPESMKVRLPYSKEEFGVPQNVYLLGTMNTADRSIAMMDTALRRRFRFIEMMPDVQLLKEIKVGNINIQKMVDTINKRIEVLYDREHTIGHAYFMGLKSEPTIENLENIFKNAIIPLLQEYFYEDYSKIQLVLGDNAKVDDLKFILDTPVQMNAVFKGNPDIDIPENKYSIQIAAFKEQASYIGIYE